MNTREKRPADEVGAAANELGLEVTAIDGNLVWIDRLSVFAAAGCDASDATAWKDAIETLQSLFPSLSVTKWGLTATHLILTVAEVAAPAAAS